MRSVSGDTFVNSLGMKFRRMEPGSFFMGSEDGEYDEKPVHRVTLTQPFYMGVTEVTNAQYEAFDPAHGKYRGERGFSRGDDEAALFVSWNDAAAFCGWLSEKEGLPCRLPTEAEWEYACRAGTTGKYHTGEALPEPFHKNQTEARNPAPVSLAVGMTPPNAFGLHDMHGNAEEWCADWYGPYTASDQTDPVGVAEGEFRVVRGGSHNTDVTCLRSACRMGALPDDRQWMTGFRVVIGDMPQTAPVKNTRRPLWAQRVSQRRREWADAGAKPFFDGPVPYIRTPTHPEEVPIYRHNHCPSITWCDNGDLLAVWFSCRREPGREMTILAARFRNGIWEEPSEFFKAPGRNMTGSALYNNGKGTLFYFNGVEAAGYWANLALVMKMSTDSGATWSAPRYINRFHQPHNQVISGTLATGDGIMIQPCDAVSGGPGGSTVHISSDGGGSWTEHALGKAVPEFTEGGSGPLIAGIHAGVVQLRDKRLLAFGRKNDINGHMPMSISEDIGKSWTYHKSEFSPISAGQRLALLRLREGPILLASFTESSDTYQNNEYGIVKSSKKYNYDIPEDRLRGITVINKAGKRRRYFGLFAALSFDEGASWPVKKLITPGGERRLCDGGAWTGEFYLDDTHAEPLGYLAATQSPDGIVHLISSRLYYRFNLCWLMEPPAR